MAECLSEAQQNPQSQQSLLLALWLVPLGWALQTSWLWQDAFWEGFVEHGWSKTSLMWVFVVGLAVKGHKIKSFSCTAKLDQVTGLKGQEWISLTVCHIKRAAAKGDNLREGRGFLALPLYR